MSSLFLELELLQPVAVSARSTTVGGHETLPYLPGSQLVGAVAQAMRLPQDGPPDEEAWRLLLSGEVRFGDAWPATPSGPAWFAPACLHHPKGNSEEVHNLARVPRGGLGQLEQVREWLVDASGRRVEVRRTHTLRTAVQEEGRAREGFLFGVEALDAGQRFLSRVDADDPDLLVRVRALLVGRTIRVGRSRSAEFGAVAVRERQPWPDPEERPGEGLVVWLLSDLAVRDRQTGAPRLELLPADLGLPAGWRVREAFVRTRRYSPYVSVRKRPDLERQVIRAGSAVVLEGPSLGAADRAELRSRVRAGLGEHLAEGLGRVALDPALLAGPRVEIAAAEGEVSPLSAPRPDDGLGRWLTSRWEVLAERERAEAQARDLRRDLGTMRIRRSQWGEIRRLAREARFRPEGGDWLVRQLDERLNSGARLHTWSRSAVERLLGAAKGARPEALERAATLLSREGE